MKNTKNGTKNRYLRTQIAITKTLLDGSKKTQNQIAKETKYSKSTISHAIKELDVKKIILRDPIKKESGYTNKGKYENKLCHLSFEIDNGNHVLNFFRSVLSEKTLSKQAENEILKTFGESEKIISRIVNNNKDHASWLKDPAGQDFFKKMLQLSPTFLKIYLNSDLTFQNFKETWLKLNFNEKANIEVTDFFLYFEMFKYSIVNDGIEGYDTQKAIDFIKEKLNLSTPELFTFLAGIAQGLQGLEKIFG